VQTAGVPTVNNKNNPPTITTDATALIINSAKLLIIFSSIIPECVRYAVTVLNIIASAHHVKRYFEIIAK